MLPTHEIIINKILALSPEESSLDLSESALYQMEHADLLEMLRRIPETNC